MVGVKAQPRAFQATAFPLPALLGEMNGAKVCGVAFHNQPRVPVIGET